MSDIRVTIGKGGRVNIPAEHRRELGLSEGEEVLVGVEDGGIRIRSRRAAIQRARSIVRRYVPEGVSLVGELSRERREEAKAEEAKDAEAGASRGS